jgi:hypothetical protein
MKEERNVKILKWLAVGIGVLFILIQFVPASRSNPKVTGEIRAPAPVMSVLRRSCYDCHSSETRWPWYSRVAPVSWTVAHDVNKGRAGLNFSAWDSVDSSAQSYLKGAIAGQVNAGEMPLPIYVWMHPKARLSPEDIRTLQDWAGAGP